MERESAAIHSPRERDRGEQAPRCYASRPVIQPRRSSPSRHRGARLPRTATLLALAAALALAAPTDALADRAVARSLVEEGTRLSSAGRTTRALERLVRAIDEDPDYLPAYEAAVPLWLRAGKFDPVIQHLARVTLRHPRYPFGWYTLAFAYRRTGRHELAVLCYREYLELRPEEADPYYGLAMSLVELDRKEEAAAALERYLAVENRPGQRDFVARARRELARLRGDPPAATPGAATWDLVRRAFGRIDAAARAAGRAFAPR
jgi:tetratricopeptide (TPR) repeat protein